MDSTNAEIATLGACLLSQEAADLAVGKLSGDDFDRHSHRRLFDAVVALRRDGRPCDSATVTELLARTGRLEEVGGPVAVHDVMASCPAPSSVATYVDLVVDHSRRRQLGRIAAEVGRAAADGSVPLDFTIGDLLDRAEEVRPPSRGLKVLSDDQLDRVAPPTWLISHVVTDGLTVMYGPSNVGKSFLALDWSLCLCLGMPWQGRDTRRRSVLYVAAEGASGLSSRRRSWMSESSRTPSGFHVVPEPVDLSGARSAGMLSEAVGDTGAEVVVLDTWARVMGGDENSTADTSAAIRTLDRLRSRHRVAVWVVHHTGHDVSRERGSSALKAAADTQVRVSGEGDRVTVMCDKQKDAGRFSPFRLRLVEVGPSAVLRPDEGPSPRGFVAA